MALHESAKIGVNSPKLPDLHILYGSQTGQAKSISEDIKRQAETKGHETTLMSMQEAASTV